MTTVQEVTHWEPVQLLNLTVTWSKYQSAWIINIMLIRTITRADGIIWPAKASHPAHRMDTDDEVLWYVWTLQTGWAWQKVNANQTSPTAANFTLKAFTWKIMSWLFIDTSRGNSCLLTSSTQLLSLWTLFYICFYSRSRSSYSDVLEEKLWRDRLYTSELLGRLLSLSLFTDSYR